MDIDPPDVQKIPPYSRVEAWVDPADAGYRVVDMIGKNLQVLFHNLLQICILGPLQYQLISFYKGAIRTLAAKGML